MRIMLAMAVMAVLFSIGFLLVPEPDVGAPANVRVINAMPSTPVVSPSVLPTAIVPSIANADNPPRDHAALVRGSSSVAVADATLAREARDGPWALPVEKGLGRLFDATGIRSRLVGFPEIECGRTTCKVTGRIADAAADSMALRTQVQAGTFAQGVTELGLKDSGIAIGPDPKGGSWLVASYSRVE